MHTEDEQGAETITMSIASSVTAYRDQPATVDLMFGEVEIDGGCFVFTQAGLEAIGSPSFELWERVGQWMAGVSNRVQFWIGDWVNYGEGHFADRVQQAVDVTEWQDETVMQAARVSASIRPEDRRPDLSFSHHRAVYAQPREKQREYLDKAKTEGWTAERLRAEVRQDTNPEVSTTCWLVVSCKDADDRDRLADAMRASGREVKPF